MMTSVVACGNGWLSRGLYRGLASEARLVLVKVGSARRIRHDDIRRGIEWVIRHRRRYGIRVVNVSCGGDYAASYLEANPALAPRQVKRLVLQTAPRLPHVEVDRQGWGVVDARRALEAAAREAATQSPKNVRGATGAPRTRPGG